MNGGMSDKPITQAISSGSEQRKNVPVVTVESFYRAHGEKLHLKLEGKRVGFHRKIREPTINRPGLALSGFYNYFAEKRVQVLGAAEQSYLKSLRPKTRVQRFRGLVRAKNSVPGHFAGRPSRAGPAGRRGGGAGGGLPDADGDDAIYQRGHDRDGSRFFAHA